MNAAIAVEKRGRRESWRSSQEEEKEIKEDHRHQTLATPDLNLTA